MINGYEMRMTLKEKDITMIHLRTKTINPFADVIKIAHLSNVLSSRYWFKHTPTLLIESTSKQTSLISRNRKQLVYLN